MRRDERRLADILEALDSVSKITVGMSESAFLADETVRFAIAHRLTVAGEAVARLSKTPPSKRRNRSAGLRKS